MKYFVVVRYIADCSVTNSYQREFDDIEAARMWGNEMRGSTRGDEEVAVLLYELKESI